MNNLLPIVASGHSYSLLFRILLLLLFIFFIGLLVLETFSFMMLFHIDLMKINPVNLK